MKSVLVSRLFVDFVVPGPSYGRGRPRRVPRKRGPLRPGPVEAHVRALGPDDTQGVRTHVTRTCFCPVEVAQ